MSLKRGEVLQHGNTTEMTYEKAAVIAFSPPTNRPSLHRFIFQEKYERAACVKGRLWLFDSQFRPADPFLQQLEGETVTRPLTQKILLFQLVDHLFLSAPVLSWLEAITFLGP